MACFSLTWLENLLIAIIVIVAAVALFKLVVPWLMGLFGSPPGGDIVIKILSIILWAIVAVACVVFAFDMIACIWPSGSVLGFRHY